MLDDGIDKPGHSLRTLVHMGLNGIPTEAVYKLIEDKDAIVRTLAAQRLQLDAESAERTFEVAEDLTKTNSSQLREVGAYILGQLVPPDYPYKRPSIPILESLISDPDRDVRATAICGLGHLGSNSSKEKILAAVRDADFEVAEAIAFALYCFTASEKEKTIVRAHAKRFRTSDRKAIETWLDP